MPFPMPSVVDHHAEAPVLRALRDLVMARTSTSVPDAVQGGRFVLARQWEGVVAEVGDASFVAVIKDLSDPRIEEEDVELSINGVRADDLPLLKPGAVFYWSIGDEDTPRGRERKSLVVFRRLPGWTERDLQRVKARAAALSGWLALDAPARSR